MKITKQNNNIIIQFNYDKKIVNAVRELPARRFNFHKKFWTVPIQHAEITLEKLKQFNPIVDPKIKEEINRQKKNLTDLEKIRNKKDIEMNFKTPLFNYQKIGVAFMLKAKNCILGDEPGLGKTIQSITVAEHNKANKVLVLCPASLKENWHEEIKKWTKRKSIIIKGTAKMRKNQWQSEANYYIANYELLLRDLELMQNINWDFIIADEATRISNPQAKSSKAIKRIKAKKRLALTGTPINNKPDDLWNIADYIRPGEFGSFWNFKQRYCICDYWGSTIGYRNLNEIRNKIQRIMIRRKKEEVLKELPPKLYEDIFTELNGYERSYYTSLKEEMIALINKNTVEATNALTQMIRLKQLTSSLELLGGEGSSKLETLKELLKDIICNGNKAVIFTQFAEMSKIMLRELEEYNPLLINGEIPANERQKIVHNFNNKSEHKIMIMTEAGAFGLNLQSASYVIHYDLSWSLSKMIQREDRCHRVGQKKNVTIYTLMARNTIDQYVRSVIYRKQKLSNFLLDTKNEMQSGKLTKEDLLELLK